jgi:hypothetical protein
MWTMAGRHSSPNRMSLLLCSLLGFLSLSPHPAAGQLKRDAANPEGKWEVLEGCRLITNGVADGDSFHMLHQGREYVIRLIYKTLSLQKPVEQLLSRACRSHLDKSDPARKH